MFFDIGGGQFLILLVLGIMLFGPDKIPKLIQDAADFVRKVRTYSDNAKRDIREELGPEFKDFEFEDLHPKRFAKKHIIDGEELGLRQLRDDLDVRKELTEVSDSVNGRTPRQGRSGRSAGSRRPAQSHRPPLEKSSSDRATVGTQLGKTTDAAPTIDLSKGDGTAGEATDVAGGANPGSGTRSAESPPFDIDAT